MTSHAVRDDEEFLLGDDGETIFVVISLQANVADARSFRFHRHVVLSASVGQRSVRESIAGNRAVTDSISILKRFSPKGRDCQGIRRLSF
jgi:hypothetical protein